MKKPLIIAIILILVVGVPIGKKYFSTDETKQVIVEALSTHAIQASILASGQLTHEQEVKLSSEVIGKVTKLYVEEGQTVKIGQLLLEIDDESFIAAVEQQDAAVSQQKIAIEKQQLVAANLKKQWLRKSQLYKKALLDEDAFEAISHSYKVAKVDLRGAFELLKQVEARLEQARDRLSKTKISSPINGIITSLDIKEGETAIAGTTNIRGSSLMTIANPESMLAEINVDEADIANVVIGQKAEIISIAFADRPINGTVKSIASSAKQTPGSQSLSFAVKLQLDNNKNVNLRPGMTCRAEVFTGGEQQKLAVPINAIITKEDNEENSVENFVFRVSGEAVEKVAIQVGISDDEFQEVLSGLNSGDQIVIGPDKILRHLKDSDEVSIKPSTDATGPSAE